MFLDPPYRKGFIDKILKNNNFIESLHDVSILVVEVDKSEVLQSLERFEMLQEKQYGDTSVYILRYQKSTS